MPYILLLLGLIVAFLVGYSGYNIQLVTDGVIWGISVPASSTQRKFKTLNRVVFVLCIIFIPFWFIFLVNAVTHLLLHGKGILILIYVPIIIGTFILSLFVARKKSDEMLYSGKETNTYVLAGLPFVKQVEAQLDKASYFIVSFEGIALINQMNYCFSLERYENYQMGSLTSPKEVALIGMYFVQKYHDQFSYKVDIELIPGEPGQTIVAFGANGPMIARTSGTKDKRIFRSYIFTKK